MTPAPLCPSFTASDLLRLLANLRLLEGVEPSAAFAQTLGQWLSLDDAIALCAVHTMHSVQPGVAACSSASAMACQTLEDEYAQMHAALVRSITGRQAPTTRRRRAGLTAARSEAMPEPTTAFAPYRREYLAQQRDMAARIGAFRAQARAVLSAANPALAKLAALDAVLDKSLGEREAKLLAQLPGLMQKRFEHLHPTHHLEAQGQCARAAAKVLAPSDWQARFRQEQQAVLLAELDLRLQPALGLLEALRRPPPLAGQQRLGLPETESS